MLVKNQQKRVNSFELQKLMIKEDFEKLSIEVKISYKVTYSRIILYLKMN